MPVETMCDATAPRRSARNLCGSCNLSVRKVFGPVPQRKQMGGQLLKLSIECLEEIFERLCVELASLGERRLQHGPDTSTVFDEHNDLNQHGGIVDLVQGNGLQWARQACDVFLVKELSLAGDLDEGLSIGESGSQPLRMRHGGSGQRNQGRMLTLPQLCVRLPLPIPLQVVLPSHKSSGCKYRNDRADGLHPSRPFRFCHTQRPPVDPQKAVLRRRHFGSPRLARIVARAEVATGSVQRAKRMPVVAKKESDRL